MFGFISHISSLAIKWCHWNMSTCIHGNVWQRNSQLVWGWRIRQRKSLWRGKFPGRNPPRFLHTTRGSLICRRPLLEHVYLSMQKKLTPPVCLRWYYFNFLFSLSDSPRTLTDYKNTCPSRILPGRKRRAIGLRPETSEGSYYFRRRITEETPPPLPHPITRERPCKTTDCKMEKKLL